MNRAQTIGLVMFWMVLANLVGIVQSWATEPAYLSRCWRDYEGIPESSVLAIAQTPDGYLWIGSPDGLLRFNGVSFTRAEAFTSIARLTGAVAFLGTDRSGRLWAVGEERLAVYDHGDWQTIDGLSNLVVRSVAESSNGQILLGGLDGELYTVADRTVKRIASPPGVTSGGVFCMSDAKDGQLWVANKGFIGRYTDAGWKSVVPAQDIPSSIVATHARAGGIWIFSSGQLLHYQADGSTTKYPAPVTDQQREMIEDKSGTIWIASISHGLYHFKPGGEFSVINTTNGLLHNAMRCIAEDAEGDIWAGGYMGGLNRFKPRQFQTIQRADGLPDNAIQAITELASGEILIGSHGNGIARIVDGKVRAETPGAQNRAGAFIWSLIQDRTGRVWIGTFNDGLFYQEDGMNHPFPVPAALGTSINRLMQDSKGRIWVGGSAGLGVIEGDKMIACFTNTILKSTSISALVEDAKSGVIWVGTHISGLFRVDASDLTKISPLDGFDGQHITSLTMDNDGCLWIGIYDRGLACYHNGRLSAVGREQGLPAGTIGSILDDGLGYFWLGTTRGVLRVSRNDLHRLAELPASTATFNLFGVSDGLASEYCSEGYQPNALRDHNGHLWFGTDRGVVTVDPAVLYLNTNPPPVKLDSVAFADSLGTNHLVSNPDGNPVVFPAGSSGLDFSFDAFSFTAPEKVAFKYYLEGRDHDWIKLGNHRDVFFRQLAPRHYVFHVTAENNDGVWNEVGVSLPFVVQPFFWQTLWFRLLTLIGSIGAGILVVWSITRQRFQRRIDQLQQQRKIEQELAAERQRASLEIKRREEYFRSLIENASDSITVINLDGIVTYQSSSGERLLGYAANQFVGKNLFDLVHPDDVTRSKAALAQAHAQMGQPIRVTSRLRHQDGSWRFVETVGTCVQTPASEKQAILNARDITDNLKLEEQLRQSQKMDAIGQLAGGVAHDFNNILSSLIMQTELMETTENLPEELREGLRQINADSRRAADLTRRLLLFGRRQVMQSRLLDLNEVVANLTKMLQRIIREDVRLELNLSGTPLLTLADAGMLEQVLINLVVNARDAMTGGGQLTIETFETEIGTADLQINDEAVPGKYVCLRVADTGGGIPPEILPRIFEPFFTTKEPGKGTGLGLATVFGIVKQHRGLVRIDNRPGQGVAFKIFLPASLQATISNRSQNAKANLPGGTETILLVEDEPAVRRSVQRLLKRHGYQVLEAADSREALKIWQEHRDNIALLFTDLVMPGGLNGQELARQLRADRTGLKVIYTSGYSAEIAGRDFQMRPGEAFLQKPVTMDQLLETVRRCLDL